MAQGGRRCWKLVAERVAYFALVEQGVGFREAARRVGVDYRLTKRWRAAPPMPLPAVEREVSPRFLSQDERVLNDRPRMTLGWDTPAERMTTLLAN